MPKLVVYLWILVKFIIFQKINCLDKHEKYDKKNNQKRILQEPEYKNIKIYIDTYYLYQKSYDSDEKFEKYQYYYNALIRAKETLEKLIQVPISSSRIDLSEYKKIINSTFFFRGNVNFYNNTLDTLDNNFDSDLIIFVTNSDNPGSFRPSQFLPYCGEYPQIHKYNENNRPIIGSIIIDDSFAGKIEENQANFIYKTEFYSYHFLHQLTHILGFNKDTINKFGDKIKFSKYNFSRVNPSDPVEREIIQFHNSDCKLMKFARDYFNCPNISFLELEDNTINSSLCYNYSHWEARIFLGEYMTANNYSQEQVISEFTLYLLEETGLYQVNNYTGGLMRFGKKKGCDFFTKDCNVKKTSEEILNPNQTTVRNSLFINEFCSGGSKSTCSPGRLSRGLCDNILAASLLRLSQYKREDEEEYWKLYGNEYADYCPISISETEINKNPKYSYIGNCNIGKKNNFGKDIFNYYFHHYEYDYSSFSSNYGEIFSDTSFCAFSSVIHKDYDAKFKGFIRPTCYQMNCSNLSLTIRINEQYIVCPRGGGYVNIGGNYEGHILCPDYNLICSQTVLCNNIFDCVKKESRMREDLEYNYTLVNVSSQIIEISPDLNFTPGYELSENGNCPINCSQCYENKKCFSCRDNIYVGDKENDNNPINCSYQAPKEYFYKKNDTHYFRCQENCKICNNSNQCFQCDPDHRLNSNSQCVPRIEGCSKYNNSSIFVDDKTNNYGYGYKECETCDSSNGYYCIGENKEACNKTNIENYFQNDKGCYSKCDIKFANCSKCNKDNCTYCKPGFFINDYKICLLGIKNCETYDLTSETIKCIKCVDNYRCLNNDQSKCIEVDNLDSYYYVDNNRDSNDCMRKCSEEYSEQCIKCTNKKCENCTENYFLSGDRDCYEKLEHCIKHSFDGNKISCLECETDFHCINNNKSICSFISNDDLIFYYQIDNETNPCYEKCSEAIPYCIQCRNKDICTLCHPLSNLTEGKCIPIIPPPGQCLVKMHEANDSINDINLNSYPINYVNNYPNFHAIDHYVNKDYTITAFIHSECTEDLLSQGYFKINCTELQYSKADKFGSNVNLTYAVFITHNYKSHLRFYSDLLEYLNSDEEDSAQNKEYIITNFFISSIQKELGPLVANLVKTEKINIFDKDSDIFNDYCTNITFFGIDMPLKERYILYTHKFSDRMACLGDNCELLDINYDDSTTTCKCKIGNKFEDILEADEYEPYNEIIKGENNFIDSIGIIKCTKNGFVNLEANVGFSLTIIGIGAQIALYIVYVLCGKPITKFPKIISNPPKKTTLILLSDWIQTKKK